MQSESRAPPSCTRPAESECRHIRPENLENERPLEKGVFLRKPSIIRVLLFYLRGYEKETRNEEVGRA